MASGRQTEDQDTPNLCTDFESVNDDWGRISGQPSRPCGEKRPQAKAGQMIATTKGYDVKKARAMWVSSTDAQV
jgi:hypothetical protein